MYQPLNRPRCLRRSHTHPRTSLSRQQHRPDTLPDNRRMRRETRLSDRHSVPLGHNRNNQSHSNRSSQTQHCNQGSKDLHLRTKESVLERRNSRCFRLPHNRFQHSALKHPCTQVFPAPKGPRLAPRWSERIWRWLTLSSSFCPMAQRRC